MHGSERRAERQRERFLAGIRAVAPSSSPFGSTPACKFLTTRELLPSLIASIKQATFLRIPQNRAARAGDAAKELRKPLPVQQRLKGTRTDRTVRAPPLRRRLRIRPPKQPKPRQISVYIPEERTHGGSGRGFGVGVLRRYIWLCVRINLRISGKARLGRIIPGIRVCDLSVERTRLFFIQRNAPWFIRPRGVKGDAMNRKRDSITRSGSDLLFRVLRQSTIGVSGFHFRVRNGIECFS